MGLANAYILSLSTPFSNSNLRTESKSSIANFTQIAFPRPRMRGLLPPPARFLLRNRQANVCQDRATDLKIAVRVQPVVIIYFDDRSSWRPLHRVSKDVINVTAHRSAPQQRKQTSRSSEHASRPKVMTRKRARNRLRFALGHGLRRNRAWGKTG